MRDVDRPEYGVNLGTNLRRLRKEAGLSVDDLKLKIEERGGSISRSHLYDVETSGVIPSGNTVPLLAEIFDVTTDELYGREPRPDLECEMA